MFGSGNRILRLFSFATHFLILIFSVIVVGVLSFFLHKFSHRGAHVVYQEVIAVLTLGFWLIGVFLPFFRSYRGYLGPLSWIFSYLWLTSFVFTAQNWAFSRCRTSRPAFGHCGLKHTVMAFTFLIFFLLVCNVLIEIFIFRSERKAAKTAAAGGAATGVAAKERPVSDASNTQHQGTTGHSANEPTTTYAANTAEPREGQTAATNV